MIMGGNICRLNAETEAYIGTFCRILETMIQEMTAAKQTDSISHNFIVQMIPHHRAAIEMSKNILEYTSDGTLRTIASGIISEQTKSIENMCAIKEFCGARKNSEQDLCCYQRRIDQIIRTMFSQMRCACKTNRINCDFMWEMIPHHKGAIKMSKTTLRFEICPELKPILEAIIRSQEAGVKQMQDLLRCLGC